MRLRYPVGASAAVVAALAARDLTQTAHTLRRNFPVLARARYALERIGPELRQYIVTGNDDERPFSRDQRRWVYTSAVGGNTFFGFGTDNNVEHVVGMAIIKHRAFARSVAHESRRDPAHGCPIPAAKVIGGPRGRVHAFRPASVVNVSAMSFGSLSHAAIEALNRGAAGAGCLHNTGEGALSPYHLSGGDLVFQIGTSYFGCRDDAGRFSLPKLQETVARGPVRMIEIKLSQGAKPGHGGVLPGSKVTKEIAEIRGIPEGVTCVSPARHTAFDDVDSMLDFVEEIAEATGLPVGIKSAVGEVEFWEQLVALMASGERGVDFITIDGGEGGTGAAPLAFTDSVSLPFRMGFSRVYRLFAQAGLADRVTFIGSGKLGLPDNAAIAFALGADMVNVAREAMLSIGCIQSQKCHIGNCPTGVATQVPWLVHGLDPTSKAARCTNFIVSLRRELLDLCEAVGVAHPGLLSPVDIDIVQGDFEACSLDADYEYLPSWQLAPALARDIEAIMADPVGPDAV